MAERVKYAKLFPEGVQALKGLGHAVNASGLEEGLIHLIDVRASQLNGCGFCIDMHWKDARALGETEQRLYGLSAWRETSFYTPRERAALAWAEAITNIQTGHAPEAVYQEVLREFGEADTVKLTYAITVINTWNRLMLAFRIEAGSYVPKSKALKPAAEEKAETIPA